MWYRHQQLSLPLSSRALTTPDPTVPAPPRANTTLSEFDMLAAADRPVEDDCLRECWTEAGDLCKASWPTLVALNYRQGPQFRPSIGVIEAPPADKQKMIPTSPGTTINSSNSQLHTYR
ncbi:hypothetical protein F7725_022382 [Dissostichus mawsoni]|uniref:Uncharacterized protein n=1 Tax=Dissostichus mawsoni TaxID=36200 RepID=A0A7J5Z0N4_DISMA|nr:hypothetical protein F7725_022382 [Dissostichus mawsoni]